MTPSTSRVGPALSHRTSGITSPPSPPPGCGPSELVDADHDGITAPVLLLFVSCHASISVTAVIVVERALGHPPSLLSSASSQRSFTSSSPSFCTFYCSATHTCDPSFHGLLFFLPRRTGRATPRTRRSSLLDHISVRRASRGVLHRLHAALCSRRRSTRSPRRSQSSAVPC